MSMDQDRQHSLGAILISTFSIDPVKIPAEISGRNPTKQLSNFKEISMTQTSHRDQENEDQG